MVVLGTVLHHHHIARKEIMQLPGCKAHQGLVIGRVASPADHVCRLTCSKAGLESIRPSCIFSDMGSLSCVPNHKPLRLGVCESDV